MICQSSIFHLQHNRCFSESNKELHYIVHTLIYRAKWIKLCGNECKPDAGVFVRVEHDLPIICQIKSINIINGNVVIFHLSIYSTSYENHHRAYVIDELLEETFCYHSTLYLHTPMHIRKSQVLPTKQFVMLPHILCTL